MFVPALQTVYWSAGLKFGLRYGAGGMLYESVPPGVFIASSCAVHVSGHTADQILERPGSCLCDELLFLAAELFAEFFELLFVKLTPGAAEPSALLFSNVMIDEFA